MVITISAPGKYHLFYFWNESNKKKKNKFTFALNIIFYLQYISPSYWEGTSSYTSPVRWSRTNQLIIIKKGTDLSVHFIQLEWFVTRTEKFKMGKKKAY